MPAPPDRSPSDDELDARITKAIEAYFQQRSEGKWIKIQRFGWIALPLLSALGAVASWWAVLAP